MASIKRKRRPGGGMKPRGPYAGNARMIVIRVQPSIREGLEKVVEKDGGSMSQHAQRALQRYVWHRDRPHVNRLTDAVAFVASQTEKRLGHSIMDNPRASAVFAKAVAQLVARYTAEASKDTDLQQLADLIAGIVGALVDGGADAYLTFGEVTR